MAQIIVREQGIVACGGLRIESSNGMNAETIKITLADLKKGNTGRMRLEISKEFDPEAYEQFRAIEELMKSLMKSKDQANPGKITVEKIFWVI